MFFPLCSLNNEIPLQVSPYIPKLLNQILESHLKIRTPPSVNGYLICVITKPTGSTLKDWQVKSLLSSYLPQILDLSIALADSTTKFNHFKVILSVLKALLCQLEITMKQKTFRTHSLLFPICSVIRRVGFAGTT